MGPPLSLPDAHAKGGSVDRPDRATYLTIARTIPRLREAAFPSHRAICREARIAARAPADADLGPAAHSRVTGQGDSLRGRPH
jgi:hypothetical protein